MAENKKIVQARVALGFDHPFFGYLSLKFGDPIERPNMHPPTMAKDGKHLFYHPDFVERVTLSELEGVIVHELGHIILLHLDREGSREHEKWNWATDYAVNSLIHSEMELPNNSMNLPKGHLYDPKFNDRTAEWIYDNMPDPPKMGGGGQGSGQSTLDDHGVWKEGKNGNGNGEGGSDNQDGGDFDGLQQQWREAIAQAANQARMQGKLPAHLETLVGELLQPKLNWKSILRDTITSCAKNDFQLFPPNRRHLYRGIYLPGITGTEITIACAIDSSGSISDEEIVEFLSEVKGICDTYEEYTIYLYVCDAAIHQQLELHPFEPLPAIIGGRGGTDFRPPIMDAEKKQLPISALVYLTDLYGPFPDKQPSFQVIWVSVSDESIKPPWGMYIRMPREEKKRR